MKTCYADECMHLVFLFSLKFSLNYSVFILSWNWMFLFCPLFYMKGNELRLPCSLRSAYAVNLKGNDSLHLSFQSGTSSIHQAPSFHRLWFDLSSKVTSSLVGALVLDKVAFTHQPLGRVVLKVLLLKQFTAIMFFYSLLQFFRQDRSHKQDCHIATISHSVFQFVS